IQTFVDCWAFTTRTKNRASDSIRLLVHWPAHVPLAEGSARRRHCSELFVGGEPMSRMLKLCAVVLFGLAAPALAQVQTGSILVRASDEQGAVTPGVSVTISSPVLVAGSMTGLTDAGGAYRFPSLVPGTYSVKLELSGFQTLVREGIVVLVGQTTPIEVALKVATLAETVTVAGQSPTVDTTSANVAVNLSEQLLQGTPGGRDIWALVEAKVPGLV